VDRPAAVRTRPGRDGAASSGRLAANRRGRREHVHARRVLVRAAGWPGSRRRGSRTRMTLLIGTWTIGLILAVLALGVFISFRIFAFPDITADGSLTLGASVAAAMIVRGHSPWVATAAAMLAGAIAGGTTGVLHTRFRINGLLAGILVATALYSVNLHVMGRSNIPMLDSRTMGTDLADSVAKVAGPVESFRLLGR